MTAVLLLCTLHIRAQNDTIIKLDINEMLICQDTVYFGINDSLIHLTKNTPFKLQRNFLLRNNIFFEKKPHKKEQVEDKMKTYYYIWNKAHSYSTRDTSTKKDNTVANAELYFKQFEGKIIRSINFSSVDMFEGEVQDTAKKAVNSISKYLNKRHTNTRQYVIRNNLRIKENDRIKAKDLSENERLLRHLDYIEDARIMVQEENHLSDSVDLVIVTQDRFPYGFHISIDDYDEFSITPYINNFMGLGDYIETGLHYNGDDSSPFGYNVKYKADNLWGSFVDIETYRIHNYDKNNYGIEIERPFKSTNMEWGGSFSYDYVSERKSYDDEATDSTLSTRIHANEYDGWIGRTFVASDNKRANISIAARTYHKHYTQHPYIRDDYNLDFHDKKGILGSTMLQNVTFFQTHKLAEFGTTEDIPVGYGLKITSGYSWNQYFKRPYLGLNFTTQIVRPKKGLISFNTTLGSFYYNDKAEDTYLNGKLNYFSPLKKIGHMEMRHFIYTNSCFLFNTRYYDPLDFSDNNMGTIQNDVEAQSTFAIQYKPTFFLPHKLLGFSFSLSPFTTLGISSEDELFYGKINTYTVHGITFRTKNESLIFSTLGVDIRYYPTYSDDNNRFIFSLYVKDSKLFETLFSPKPELNKN